MAAESEERRVRALVRAQREALRLKQGDVAKRVRPLLPPDRQKWAIQSNISKYEKGDLGADLDLHVALLAAVGLSLADIAPPTVARGHKATKPIDPILLAALREEGTAEDVQAFLEAPAPLRRLLGEGARLIAAGLAPPQVDAPTPAKARGKRTAFPAAPRRASGRG
jgi:hypothetical protein